MSSCSKSELKANSIDDTGASLSGSAGDLERRLGNHTARVAVVGLGYVGLPLACRFASDGYYTYAYDVDPQKVDKLRNAESYLSHIDSAWIAESMVQGTLAPTTEPGVLAAADAILICVPTPLTAAREPDLSFVDSTARTIADFLRPGQLIVLESTTWPGTTREVILPILEAGGLQAGRDFFIAYSPEREDPGNVRYDAGNTPKVVSGFDESSCQLAEQLYGAIVEEVVPVESLETAEATKLVENIYRAVNIALVNELKVLFDRMGINVWSVIDAAKTKPFGYQAFYPGPGLGGHCIPIDPFYLTWLARKHDMTTRFIELAGEINTKMPRFVVHRIVEALNEQGKPTNGSRICILGVAYKKDVDDCRESPAFAVMELLRGRGAEIAYNDPFVPKLRPDESQPGLESCELTPGFLASQDAVVLLTDHTQYDVEDIVQHSQLVIDTRNATRDVLRGRRKIYPA